MKKQSSILVVLFLLFITLTETTGQTVVPQQFGIWKYDSNFYIGASGMVDPHKAVEEYHMTFDQQYAQDIDSLRNIINREYYPGLVDINGFWPTGTGFGNGITNYADSLRKLFYLTADTYNYKVTLSPSGMQGLVHDVVVTEHYFKTTNDMQNYTFSYTLDTLGELVPFTKGDLIQGRKVLSNNGADTILIAGDPRFTFRALRQSGAGLYSQIGLSDSSMFFDVSVSMKVTSPKIIWDTLSNNTVISFVDLFVRDMRNQTDSIYAIYRKIGRFNITKGLYDTASSPLFSGNKRYLPAGAGFFDVMTTIDLSNPVYDLPLVTDNIHGWRWLKSNTQSATGNAVVNSRLALSPSDTNWLPPGSFNRSGGKVEDSEFIFRFYTTRIVDVSFVRGRVQRHIYNYLRNGAFDTIIHGYVGELFQDTSIYNFDRRIFRLGVADEVHAERIVPFTTVNARMQDTLTVMNDHRGIYMNPPSNADGVRIFSGDFDSVRVGGQPAAGLNKKLLQVVARQDYNIGYPLPVTYANLDKLGFFAADSVFGMAFSDILVADTIYRGEVQGLERRYRMILGNSMVDYGYYTGFSQHRILGRFEARNDPSAIIGGIQHIPAIARLVDVSRFKYRNLPGGEYSHPVWNVVQTHGWIDKADSGRRYAPEFRAIRIPTPEEISVLSWLSLNCNVSGIIYADFCNNGDVIGPIQAFTREDTAEYGTHLNPLLLKFPDPTAPRIDSMWLGRASRSAVIKEVTGAIYRVDTLIGWKNLIYNQEQVSVHDTAHYSLTDMPMLADIRTIRAKRYELDSGAFIRDSAGGQPLLDTRDSTFLEVTHFRPSIGDSLGYASQARYCLITNRRLWPVDYGTYSTTTTSRFSTYAPCNSTGLGAIDVRMPRIVFKNSTSVIADRFIIERVGDTIQWRDTASFGDTVDLQWLKPGRGALYRIIPLTTYVSEFGTAFNNAVRSENPTNSSQICDRVFVYERDSAIYLRAIDSIGQLSPEHLISDTVDLDSTTRGYNMHPALATVRDGSSCMVVWERRSANKTSTTVEGRFFETIPQRTNWPNNVRVTLTQPRTLSTTWQRMTPSITGIVQGYIVSWASPKDGIEVKAIRDNFPLNSPNPLLGSDTSVTLRVFKRSVKDSKGTTILLDSASLFPTLAYYWNNDTHVEYDSTTDITSEIDWPTISDPIQIAHLAYQQGKPNTGNAQFIMYNRIGVDFSGILPKLWISQTEHVSAGLAGCGFLHPSIAADSNWIGVAFQTNRMSDRIISLRFRDPVLNMPSKWPWGGNQYFWSAKPAGSTGRYFEWPSLTQPPLSGFELGDGMLAWFETFASPPTSLKPSKQWMYHYENGRLVELGNGEYPSMTLVAHKGGAEVLELSSVFYRGDTTTGVELPRIYGDSARYYPLFMENKPGAEQTAATSEFYDHRYGSMEGNISLTNTTFDACQNVYWLAGLNIRPSEGWTKKMVENRWDIRTNKTGLPPSFFAPAPSGQEDQTLDDATNITRTGVFAAGSEPLYITRTLTGSVDLVPWLDEITTDSLNPPADVKVLLELVRDIDSVVLWSADTVSARDIGASTVEESVEVPVNTAAGLGEHVYIRMRHLASDSLKFFVNAGFQFVLDDTTELIAYQKVRRNAPHDDVEVTIPATELAVVVIPNPALDHGILRLRVSNAGRVNIAIYDMLGRTVRTLPTLDALQQGEYISELNLSTLPRGMYTVQIQQGSNRASTQFTVVR